MPGRGAHRKEMGERWRVVNTLRLLRLSRSMGWRRRGGESLSPSPSLSPRRQNPSSVHPPCPSVSVWLRSTTPAVLSPPWRRRPAATTPDPNSGYNPSSATRAVIAY